MSEFEQKVLEELGGLKVQMHQLMGVGQPGRLHMLEQRVEAHERNMQRLRGVMWACSGVLGIVQFVLLLAKGR